ncbi:hypothetical protein BH09VER1_BH09VER1_24720 [soil metagenome]
MIAELILGQDPEFLVKLVGGIAALYAIYRHINTAKREIVADLKKELRLDQSDEENGQKREIGPQPFKVSMHADCVKRPSYETHCRLNREAHDKIEKAARESQEKLELQVKSEFEKISAAHSKLSREVGEINVRSEGNEQRLIQMDTKLDKIRDDLRK